MAAMRRLLTDDACVACGAPRVGMLALCAPCRRSLVRVPDETAAAAAAPWPELASVTGLWLMEDGSAARALVHALKYRSMPLSGIPIGERLARLPVPASLRGCPVVPVPLHRVRERERGYNQALYLARGLVSAGGGGAPIEALERVRADPSSTHLARVERAAGRSHVFRARLELPSGPVLLVDDVFTTGSTAASAARALLAAGATEVHAVVVGLTPARRRALG